MEDIRALKAARLYSRVSRRMHTLAWRIAMFVVAASAWMDAAGLAWAKGKKEEVVEPEKSYTFPYLVVIMFVAIGLMTVCRPSRRADKGETKPKEE
jgi:hypothetical protein